MQDHDGARGVLAKLATTVGFGRVRRVWADSAYKAHALAAWIKALLPGRGLRLSFDVLGPHSFTVAWTSARAAATRGFVVLPRRWVVERTFAWLDRCRRLSKDYEAKTAHSEAMIRVASIALMVRRLAPKPAF